MTYQSLRISRRYALETSAAHLFLGRSETRENGKISLAQASRGTPQARSLNLPLLLCFGIIGFPSCGEIPSNFLDSTRSGKITKDDGGEQESSSVERRHPGPDTARLALDNLGVSA